MAHHFDRRNWITNVERFEREIFENLDLPGLLIYARNHRGLSRSQIERIEAPLELSEKVRRFIDLFKDMTYECMEQVIEALNLSGQEHIALLIAEGKWSVKTGNIVI